MMLRADEAVPGVQYVTAKSRVPVTCRGPAPRRTATEPPEVLFYSHATRNELRLPVDYFLLTPEEGTALLGKAPPLDAFATNSASWARENVAKLEDADLEALAEIDTRPGVQSAIATEVIRRREAKAAEAMSSAAVQAVVGAFGGEVADVEPVGTGEPSHEVGVAAPPDVVAPASTLDPPGLALPPIGRCIVLPTFPEEEQPLPPEEQPSAPAEEQEQPSGYESFVAEVEKPSPPEVVAVAGILGAACEVLSIAPTDSGAGWVLEVRAPTGERGQFGGDTPEDAARLALDWLSASAVVVPRRTRKERRKSPSEPGSSHLADPELHAALSAAQSALVTVTGERDEARSALEALNGDITGVAERLADRLGLSMPEGAPIERLSKIMLAAVQVLDLAREEARSERDEAQATVAAVQDEACRALTALTQTPPSLLPTGSALPELAALFGAVEGLLSRAANDLALQRARADLVLTAPPAVPPKSLPPLSPEGEARARAASEALHALADAYPWTVAAEEARAALARLGVSGV